MPPDTGTGGTDLRPAFVVRQHSGQGGPMLCEDSADEADADAASDDDDSAGNDFSGFLQKTCKSDAATECCYRCTCNLM